MVGIKLKLNPRFEVFTGPMFGGKTTRLLAALERYSYQNKNIILFKPKIDVRYSEESVVTHSGIKWNAKRKIFSKVIRVENSAELTSYFNGFNEKHDIDIVAVDEVFMIEGSAAALIDIYKMGKTILVSSLQLSSSGEPYREMIEILPWATNIQICPAVCSVCGEDAFFTRKIAGGDEGKIEVGGSELYQPRCFSHYVKE